MKAPSESALDADRRRCRPVGRSAPGTRAGGGAPALAAALVVAAAALHAAGIGGLRDGPGRPVRLYDVPLPHEPLDARDSLRLEAILADARALHLDTLEIGDLVIHIGRGFLGAPYIAGSLDPPGPERLIVNLRAFDCVTYVETVLAIARTVRAAGDVGVFRTELAGMRYRDGRVPSYTGRLHYFSDWIATNEARGLVEDVTARIGGEPDRRSIHFMTSNAGAYPQLADAAHAEAIRATERVLTARPRYRVPQSRLAGAAGAIRNGDIIAATSTLDGLDVAHTGFALWADGRLLLMHAPLAGGVVEISARPLAERIRATRTQDGVMVARPR
jgi:hypothetical protein